MAVCVLCGSPDNLNTAMTVTLEDGSKAEVVICDADADDVTPRQVREAYLDKKKQIDAVLAQARALGLDLAPQGAPEQKIVVMQQVAPQPAQQAPPPALPAGVSPLLEDEEGPVISTAHLLKPMRSVGGNAQSGQIRTNVLSHQSHALDELGAGVLGGKAKVTVVEGRDGVPMQLPSIIQDGTGTTRVRVAKTLDDYGLQRRFKSLGQESRWDRGPDFRNGYEEETERPCPICRGQGTTVHAGHTITCPKCKGVGTITVVGIN